ncbi:hypothetical protein CC515_17330 [Salmonella enterica subsp. enterica serovar Austin]|uniref:Fimbrial-type adhesion domain-containing protein n=2 Tax=Salmonella enterica TaxID=28901 RepID=A0A5X3PBG0_SALET|nr:fimbrial protein [Salmonella enterica]EBF0115188.1 hypothetical protein [Salmonella enterica subsp. enterica]EDH9622408.1 hypothetical protein [Salmonella enterica subsp. enterica serovar Austin]EDR2627196.1 fimbrial protein [Salmonella enterica subsp. enterica serovar Thompson]EJU7758227.1 fimbrial protein [Salmonella enterica subsp. enterica serovar 11:b:1,7]EJU7768211.1 fimbrial protein [Salmonella enterica subsp. enterica serovar 6,14:a:1,7]
MRMFRNMTGRWSFLLLAKIALTGWLVLYGQAWAAQECRFGNGGGGTTYLVNGSYPQGIRWAANGGGQMLTMRELATFELNLSPTLTSECSMGNDGRQLGEHSTDVPYTYTRGRGPQIDGEMGNYYTTNIEGVVFSVKIYSSAGGGYFGGGGDVDSKGWSTLVNPSDTIWDGKTWKARITIWQDSYDFVDSKGNQKNYTTITPLTTFSLGEMTLGDPSDSNNKPWTFMVTPTTFQVPIVTSTCQTAQLDEGNNIDLGEYMMSDFNASPRTTNFRVQILGCDNVWAVDVKLLANKTTGSQNELLGNTLQGGAEGVGVQLYADNSTPLPPNGLAFTRLSTTTAPGSSFGLMNFSAQLVKDGKAMKAGEFKGIATLNLSYY